MYPLKESPNNVFREGKEKQKSDWAKHLIKWLNQIEWNRTA